MDTTVTSINGLTVDVVVSFDLKTTIYIAVALFIAITAALIISKKI